ncbi:MAG: NAD(P)-dependent oxidoreductase, partial [Haliscomenobacter sp.]
MKIIVFGATGGTGTFIVEQALSAGHAVTVFVRNPGKLSLKHPKMTIIQGDLLNSNQVDNAMVGMDAVVSAVGPTRPFVPGLMEKAAKNIIIAMQKTGIRRLIYSSGTVIRDPLDRPKLTDKLTQALMSLSGREILHDAEISDHLIRATNFDWTIVRF